MTCPPHVGSPVGGAEMEEHEGVKSSGQQWGPLVSWVLQETDRACVGAI